MAKYCFPAIIAPDEPGFMVTFPDIENCFTSGENLVDALEMGEDVLNLMLVDMEDDKKEIPAPSALNAARLSRRLPSSRRSTIPCRTTTRTKT